MTKVNGNGETKLRHHRHTTSDSDSDRYPQGWNELGDFIVSFGYIEREGRRHLQTRAYYSQGNEQDTVWDGVVMEDMFQWMIEQSRSFLPAGSIPPAHETLDMEIVDLHLDLTDGGLQAVGRLRIYDPRHHKDEPGSVPGTNFRAEMLLVNLETGAEVQIGVQEDRFQGQELARDIRMDFPPPALGRYQLKGVVTVTDSTPDSGVVSTQALGPTMRVEN